VDPVLALDEERPTVEPGGEARVSATVRNAGEVVEQYRLEVLGDAARWSQVVPRQVSVLPGGAGETTVELVFRPPPPPLTVAGEVPFGLRCVSLEAPDRCAVVEGALSVGAVIGVAPRLEPVSPAGRWTGRYRVMFDNTGSVPVRLRLRGDDARQVLRFALAPAELTVEPARPTAAYLAVKPRQPMLRGKPVTHQFNVKYEAAGDRGGDLPGVFEQRPILNKGVVAVAVLLVAAVVLGAALLLRNAGRPAAPVASAGPPPPVALADAVRLTDTSIQVTWQRSPYATGYVVQLLLADGGVAGSKDVADRDQSALSWGELTPGQHCFRVLVVGTGGRSEPSGARCAVLARPLPTPSAPVASAPPAAGAAGPVAPPTGRPSPTATPKPPPAAGGDPVKAGYVVYVPPTAIDDKAAQGVAEGLVAKLQTAGVQARLVDSRTSNRVADGQNGLWVVLRDGFPTFQAALAECNAHRDVAPDCIAFPP
jgi:hypothetical protein